MELFHQNGHLTNAAFAALQEGTLDELSRLEAAEHLSFCDACLEKYTAFLTGEALIEPPASLRAPVLKRIRQRTRKILFSRYATVAAAAVIAVGIFSGGMLLGPGRSSSPYVESGPAGNQTQETGAFGFTDRFNNGMNSITGRVNSFFNDLLTPAAPTAPAVPTADTNQVEQNAEAFKNPFEQRQQELAERERLFEKDEAPENAE